MKTANGIVTKYVYGKGLIGEQKCDEGFKTYHFDYRGSTVAITNQSGNITDTFKYDTYGNMTGRTGSSFVIFGYNGRDGVVTDKNGLIYMRARYYSPAMRRFVNADIIAGEISNAITLNRYAYANGNPVSNVDPFGLSAEDRGENYITSAPTRPTEIPYDILQQILKLANRDSTKYYYNEDYANKAVIKVDKNGNITYIFYNYNDGFTHDSFTKTEYYFEVKKASYWQSKLDVEVSNLHKLFDNNVVDWINGTLDMVFSPGNGLPIQAEFAGQVFTISTTALASLTENDIKHNTELSEYLYNKVIYKNPDQDVAILKSAKTYTDIKWFWEDSFELEKIIDRDFF